MKNLFVLIATFKRFFLTIRFHFGIDGIIGVDYKIKGAPLNLSLDWNPSFEFGTNSAGFNSLGGLAIRFAF